MLPIIELLNDVMCYFLSDPTLTTDNVAQVMELVNVWRSIYRFRHGALVIDYTIIPDYQMRDIKQKFITKKEMTNAYACYYVSCHPESSWTHLARRLYSEGEFAAVEKLKPFLPLRGKYQVISYAGAYQKHS